MIFVFFGGGFGGTHAALERRLQCRCSSEVSAKNIVIFNHKMGGVLQAKHNRHDDQTRSLNLAKTFTQSIDRTKDNDHKKSNNLKAQ